MCLISKPVFVFMLIMCFCCFLTGTVCADSDFIDWENLQNPLYSHPGWATKDACVVHKDDCFYIFFSAFYLDNGRERSHVTAVKTKDFKTFSDPLFIWDGQDDGYIGMCSPNITKVKDQYVLTYNSWGHRHPRGMNNELFYAVSKDLENWDKHNKIASNLLKDKSVIDIALAYYDGKYYIVWQNWRDNDVTVKRNRIAVGNSLDGDFSYIGDGYLELLMGDGYENGMIHENFSFVEIDGQWYLLSTDYRPHNPYLYKMSGDPDDRLSWKTWTDGYVLEAPLEDFNTYDRANASFLVDWSNYDGYYYLLYAGTTESETHDGRGNNKLALARSKDLVNWNAPGDDQTFIDWDKLRNPVFSYPHWSTKDVCVIRHEEQFYVFFSAFYFDRGRERSHVVGVKTKDFVNYSEPLFIWDGVEDGWIGMCSPNITKIQDKFYLTYNSWGDKAGKPNDLFYAVSTDLEHWDKHNPLADNLTTKRDIDGAVAYENGRYYLVWKQGRPHRTKMAVASDIDGPWEFIGNGLPRLLMQDGSYNGLVHENFEFIKIDGKWHLMTTAYKPSPTTFYLYKMKDSGERNEHWLEWRQGRKILMPQEYFNSKSNSNAGFIADWRKHDGWFYMIYAGRTEGNTHARRGDNRIALARSKDLVNWVKPGPEKPFILWDNLKNPVYSHPGWSTKDACIAYRNGTFYVFFSAFYHDKGRERSHVVGVKTKDFIHYSDALFKWSGYFDGWTGMCSPNITRKGNKYYMTYNSWGDDHSNGMKNQLFYAVSDDLENWQYHRPLAWDITVDEDGNQVRAIDAAVTFFNDKVYLAWKEVQTPMMAVAEEIGKTGWTRLGELPGEWAENYQFINLDGFWYLLGTVKGPKPRLMKMCGSGYSDSDWLNWSTYSYPEIAMESFNTDDVANAAFIADWRHYDGYMYMVYAGRTEDISHLGRGNNKLGLARLKTFVKWNLPGQE